jgi:pimeloyl-ACP methyl ester carboxylesterase
MAFTKTEPRLAYTLSGPADAPVIVFVNGLGGAQAAFTLQVRHFARTRRVLTFDHRGVGGSAVVDASAHMADFAADLIRILDEAQIIRADFVGLSFGGRVIQQLAAGWPERVRRLVLGGTSAGGALHYPGNVDAHRTMRLLTGGSADVWARQIAPLLFGRQYVEAYPDRIQSLARWRARYPVDPVGLARQWEAYDGFDMGDQLSQIGCPVLVVHGDDDALSPLANATALASGLPAAELLVLEGIGHSPNVECSSAFNAAIEAFVDHQ